MRLTGQWEITLREEGCTTPPDTQLLMYTSWSSITTSSDYIRWNGVNIFQEKISYNLYNKVFIIFQAYLTFIFTNYDTLQEAVQTLWPFFIGDIRSKAHTSIMQWWNFSMVLTLIIHTEFAVMTLTSSLVPGVCYTYCSGVTDGCS